MAINRLVEGFMFADVAGEDLSDSVHKMVKLGSTGFTLCGDNEKPLGAIFEAAAEDAPASVYWASIIKAPCSAAIAKGARVACAANGAVKTSTGTNPIGIALNATTAAGEIVSVAMVCVAAADIVTCVGLSTVRTMAPAGIAAFPVSEADMPGSTPVVETSPVTIAEPLTVLPVVEPPNPATASSTVPGTIPSPATPSPRARICVAAINGSRIAVEVPLSQSVVESTMRLVKGPPMSVAMTLGMPCASICGYMSKRPRSIGTSGSGWPFG